MRLQAALACTLALSACAAPVAGPATREQVNVSATQWNLVAAEIAGRFEAAIGRGRPVAIEVPGGKRPALATGFGDMLATALVNRGHAVSYVPSSPRPGPDAVGRASRATVRFDFRRVLEARGLLRPLPELELSASLSVPGPLGRQDVARETRTFYVPGGDGDLLEASAGTPAAARPGACREVLYAVPYSGELRRDCKR
jgi:hypothetical protein